MKEWHERIIWLFGLLAVCNAADSDKPLEAWTVSYDASQAGLFGKIADAIIEMAGTDIYQYWCETGEVKLTLAKRA